LNGAQRLDGLNDLNGSSTKFDLGCQKIFLKAFAGGSELDLRRADLESPTGAFTGKESQDVEV